MQEIERKFLVRSDDYKSAAQSRTKIAQGYLNSHPDRTVRVRIRNEHGFLTVKGKPNASGLTRFEWEKQIPLAEAEALLQLCEPGIIEKIRYEVSVADHTYEVDRFLGANKGLTVAEIELGYETEAFQKPDWLGKEVTSEVKYHNAELSKNPYQNW